MNNEPVSHYHWLDDNILILNLQIIPGAQKSNFAGISNGNLRIKLNAQPRDNEANDALIQFLAKKFAIPKSQINIISGFKSRLKRVSLRHPKTLPMEAEISIKK